MPPKALSAACEALDATLLVAREQRPVFDRWRDPLRLYGANAKKDKEAFYGTGEKHS
jgi:hypothetical protein